jgi:hypothetical protein
MFCGFKWGNYPSKVNVLYAFYFALPISDVSRFKATCWSMCVPKFSRRRTLAPARWSYSSCICPLICTGIFPPFSAEYAAPTPDRQGAVYQMIRWISNGLFVETSVLIQSTWCLKLRLNRPEPHIKVPYARVSLGGSTTPGHHSPLFLENNFACNMHEEPCFSHLLRSFGQTSFAANLNLSETATLRAHASEYRPWIPYPFHGR